MRTVSNQSEFPMVGETSLREPYEARVSGAKVTDLFFAGAK
jgi:hypothetical protein